MDATTRANPQWAAAVIQDGRAHVAYGNAAGSNAYPLALGIMGEPARLLKLAAATGRAPEITIVVDRVPIHAADGRDVRPPQDQLAILAEMCAADGWKAGAAALELGSGWITWTRDKGTPVVHMAIRSLLGEFADGDLIHPDDEPGPLAERLVRYATLTGAAYRANPGASGLGALRNWYDVPVLVRKQRQAPSGAKLAGPATYGERPEPRFIWNGAPTDVAGAGPLVWRRNPTADERQMRNVFAFDTRAAYLAAAAGARLGWHEPKHTGAIAWDPAQSGLYRIRARGAEWVDANRRVPIVSPARLESDGTTWVTGPVLALLSEMGYALPEIIDSWTCAGVGGRDIRADITGRYLSGWSDRLRDALPDAMTAGDPLLRVAVKRTYSRAIGLMARPGGRVYRRDWQATIQDEARCRLLRRIYRHHEATGAWPLQVKTDCVWYASDDEDPAALGAVLGEGPRIGHMRHDAEHSGTMAWYLDDDKRQTAARRARRGQR